MAAIVRRPLSLRLPRPSPIALTYSKRSIAAAQWQTQAASPSRPQTQIRGFRDSAAGPSLEQALGSNIRSLIAAAVYEKRYTKDHEWIELDDDKTQ
ncbi:MAG: hypothetical protein Q9211_004566, partial [Gyalolechia sp. 1 TL-2023]